MDKQLTSVSATGIIHYSASLINVFRNHWHVLIFAVLALLSSCSGPDQRLSEGTWRGVLSGTDKEIPFNFTLNYSESVPVLTYRNGEDLFVTDSTIIKGDTLVFPVDVYNAKLVAIPSGGQLKGYWVNDSRPNHKVNFEAHPDEDYRFWLTGQTSPSNYLPTGRWGVVLSRNDGSETPAIAEFGEQNGRVHGTILTTTGDYRFLEGQKSGNALKLSSFAGGGANLIDLQFVNEDSLSGTIGGLSGVRNFHAVRNENAMLPDAYGLTYLKDGYESLDFTFPDMEGNKVSLSDKKYRDKVKVITIMGTWCPNCMDEAAFLGPWYEENKERGVEVIALSFEQKEDLDYVRPRVERFTKRFDVGYEVLLAGNSSKEDAAETLPELNAVLSFPTTIFVDREGKVRKIHTGFSGPATGEHYEEFVREFNSTVDELLADNKTI